MRSDVNGGKQAMTADGRTLSAQIHDAILEMIIDAGADSEKILLTERELVEKFGVSKAPVREALLRLCAEQVLNRIRRCGYVVVRLGEKSGRDNLAVRQILELSSLEMCFDAFTPERIREIEANLKTSCEGLKGNPTVWQLWQANLDFHCDLIATSGNRYLVKHLKNCIEVERRFYAQNHYTAANRFVSIFHPEPHERILDAIRKGDRALALQTLKMDISGDPLVCASR